MVANAADAHIQGGQEPTADFTALTDTQLISLEGACAMILSGDVPAGYGLPSDETLAYAAHVTATDAREAKRELERLGMVVRSDSGYYAASPPEES